MNVVLVCVRVSVLCACVCVCLLFGVCDVDVNAAGRVSTQWKNWRDDNNNDDDDARKYLIKPKKYLIQIDLE